MPSHQERKAKLIIEKAKQNISKLDKKAKEKSSGNMLHDCSELGKVELDHACPSKNTQCTSVAQENGCQYSVNMNYTDVANNNNKYYIMQLHTRYDGTYELFSRYGRVGNPG